MNNTKPTFFGSGYKESGRSDLYAQPQRISNTNGLSKFIIPRFPAARNRVVSKYPPPFHPDATPHGRLNFHVSVKKACASHHASGVRLSKVVIIGDSAVGKTALVNRFCRDAFERDYKATIGVDFEVERFDVLCQPYNLQMWDTAGQERFRAIAAAYYRDAHIVIVAFDLTRRETLDAASQWLNDALKETDPERALTFLVGAKRDLLSDEEFDAFEPRCISVANKLRAELWITSAKTGYNVDELFHRVAALGFESLVREENHFEEEDKKGKIGNVLTNTDVIDLKSSDLFEKNPSGCCKLTR